MDLALHLCCEKVTLPVSLFCVVPHDYVVALETFWPSDRDVVLGDVRFRGNFVGPFILR